MEINGIEDIDLVPDPDYLDNLIGFIYTANGIHLLQFALLFTFIIFCCHKLLNLIINHFFKNRDKRTNARICDTVSIDESDSGMTHPDAIDYIKEHYGPKAVENLGVLVDRAEDLHTRLTDNLASLKHLLHLSELDMLDKNNLREVINCSGILLIRVEKDFRVFMNIFEVLIAEDASYIDDYKEITNIHIKCLDLERRTTNLCIALLTENSHD